MSRAQHAAEVFDTLAAALKNSPAWLQPYALHAQRLLSAHSMGSVAGALNAVTLGSPVSFVEHAALPAGEPYESFIARTSTVPTRDNLHDLFNGLIWLSYPHVKQRLNGLQAQHILRHGASGPRGALRDALTVFDENAALLQAPAAIIEALRQRDWHSLFIEHRALWQSTQLVLFGHALLEKLLLPRKDITAHVWLVPKIDDESTAATLSSERLTTKAFLPLPVLGVPGWWSSNEAPEFYADTQVFRPLKR